LSSSEPQPESSHVCELPIEREPDSSRSYATEARFPIRAECRDLASNFIPIASV
ncbi:hypothetical protein ILUMI_14431, partial [Ignelater luminosus]